MSTLLDIVGSMFIGLTVILLITNLNVQMMDSSREQIQANGSQYLALGLSTTTEYDFYKIGYRDTSSNTITQADSTLLYFLSDIDNNATVDTLRYYLGSSPYIRSTNEYALYRQINSGTAQIISYATSFKLIYYDSLGVKINYASLSSSAQRNRIKTVEINAVTRSEAGAGSDYESTVWNKKIRPKNL